MTARARATRNVTLVFVGTLISRAAAFLALPLMTHGLTLAEYGRFEMLYAAGLFAVPLASLMCTDAFLARFQTSPRSALSAALKIETIGALLCIGTLGVLWRFGWLSPPEFIALGLFVLTSIYWQQLRATLRAMGHYASMAAAEILLAVTMLGLLYFFLPRFGVSGALGAWTGASLMAMMLALGSARRVRRLLFNADAAKEPAVALLPIALPMVPNVLIWWFIEFSDRFLLTLMLNEEAVGLYSAGARIASLLLAIALILYQVWQIEAVARLDSDQRRVFFEKSLSYWLLTVCFGATVLLALGPWLVALLLPVNMAPSATLLCLMVPTGVLVAMCYFFGVTNFYGDDARSVVIPALSAAVINLVFNLLLIPWLGLIGAAASSMLAFATMLYMRRRYARVRLRIGTPVWREIVPLCLVLMQSLLVAAEVAWPMLLFAPLCLIIVFWSTILELLQNAPQSARVIFKPRV